MQARPSVVALAAILSVGACDRNDKADSQHVQTPVGEEYASSLTAFDILPGERERLEELSARGDSEASFRIAQFYIFAGGDGDPNFDDAHDRRQKRHWLEVAARQGHRSAQFNLAVDLAPENCRRARRMMTYIVETALEEDERASGQSWLDGETFDCR